MQQMKCDTHSIHEQWAIIPFYSDSLSVCGVQLAQQGVRLPVTEGTRVRFPGGAIFVFRVMV